ncbi:50S ribosomal protein L22 [Candidatus Woesearchaeota archaeon]|nr:50S ribosomal protein L22 [Candidatus Woesearchaeota archaeon]
MEIKENQAQARGDNLDVSYKQSVELCRFLKGKKVIKAKKILEDVMILKQAIPFKVYVRDIAHRKGGMGSGKYPVKAADYVLRLLKSAESNAKNKGLNAENLFVNVIIPNKASTPMRPGRIRGRKAKRTSFCVIIEERSSKDKSEVKK